MVLLKVYVFSEERNQIPMKTDGLDDLTSQSTSVEVFSEFNI